MPSRACTEDLIHMRRKILLGVRIKTNIQEKEHKILSSKLEPLSGISVNFGSTPRLQQKATSNQHEYSRSGSIVLLLYCKWR
jgi:hypothetical protein